MQLSVGLTGRLLKGHQANVHSHGEWVGSGPVFLPDKATRLPVVGIQPILYIHSYRLALLSNVVLDQGAVDVVVRL